ncbi:MAG TPA: PIN domain nuclease [Thermodesulfobacteriota bacterium]|nr:PIN domain nuclease [Thermodesulfobacteriota bacterium]
MFLIDSSVWVEYLRPKGSMKVKDRLREILQREEALSCGVVVVEILRGAKNEKDFQALHDSLISLPQIPIDDGVIERASKWGFLLDRKGKSVSTTDLLIAAATYEKARLLHADSDFEIISSIVDLEEERVEL